MDLNFSPEDEAFRQEVRDFIADNFPDSLKGRTRRDFASREDFLAWHKVLYKKGWVAPLWPKEYGGTGWTVTQRYIFNEECAAPRRRRSCPSASSMVGPVIYTFGNEAQKKQFLPRILSGEDWWCQGYSEPGAGSDLASLKTRAVREGDHYIVNGQKTWTTLAQYRRLDLLPGAHRSGRQAAGRHLLPAHRHEDAGHHREADHPDGRRP